MAVVCTILVVVCAVEALYVVVCLAASRETDTEVRGLIARVHAHEIVMNSTLSRIDELEEDFVVALLEKKE